MSVALHPQLTCGAGLGDCSSQFGREPSGSCPDPDWTLVEAPPHCWGHAATNQLLCRKPAEAGQGIQARSGGRQGGVGPNGLSSE